MKRNIGDVCAHLPAHTQHGGKARYVRVGTAFIDEETDRLAFKLDALPLSTSGWEGWLNVFPPKNPGDEQAP